MGKYIIFVTFIYLCSTIKMKAEIFSSIAKIELLLTTQKNVIDTFSYLISNKNIKSEILKTYLHRFELEHLKAMIDIPKYIGNPVNCYRLIKRLTVDIKLMERVLIGISDYKRNKSVIYPSNVDMKGAARGLLEIEWIYGINKSDLAAGVWNTSFNNNNKVHGETFNQMTISDCYELGKVLYKSKNYMESVGWLMEARNKYNDEWRLYPEDNHIQLEDIIKQLNKAYTRYQNKHSKFINWLREISVDLPYVHKIENEVLVFCYENGFKVPDIIKYVKSTNYYFYSTSLFQITRQQLNKNYANLCKGKIIQKNIFTNAKCYLAYGPHPFLKLAPIKAELLFETPLVILFHEIINDSEIKTLKEYALPRLTRSAVFSENQQFGFSYSRTCQEAEVVSLVETRIKTRTEHFSGMKLTASADPHVANYGIGGQCKLHRDYWDNDTITARLGERIATVVLYLSEVEQGGATVFPILGISVFPVKGAALYWVNLLPSGRGDPRTYHAACPVLRGSKWVLTQWINQRGQEFNRPCPLNSKPTIELQNNAILR